MNKTKNDDFGLLQEMAASGVPVDLSTVTPDLEISLIGGTTDSMVFDLPDGRAGCFIDLFLLNHTLKPFRCRDIQLQPPWSDGGFEWLPDPKEKGVDPFNYHFPGKSAPVMPRDVVLNHILLGGRMLKPRCPLDGFLLGIGNPKPKQLTDGAWIDFRLTILADNDNEYPQTIPLRVDPGYKYRRDPSRKIAWKGIYASAPPISDSQAKSSEAKLQGKPLHGHH